MMLDNDKDIRKTDSPFHDPVQSSRFVKMEEGWFYLTREDGVQGPFPSQEAADQALQQYLLGGSGDVPATASDMSSEQTNMLEGRQNNPGGL